MNPAAIKIAKRDIDRVLDDLNAFLGDDEQLKLDMLEGETDLFSIIRQLLNENEADEGIILALEEQIGSRQLRKDRAKARIDRRKTAMSQLMDCAQTTKLGLPEATLSLRTLQPRPKVVDVDQLPDAFVKVSQVRKADNDAIAVAIEGGASIPGVVMTNGGSSLTVRRK
jgi:hypothetical protein